MAERFGLYVILTDPVAGYTACGEAAVAQDVRYLQLRMKDTARHRVIEVGRRLRAITRGTRTRFIVNDDVHAAMATDADGVHLGQEDMPLPQARRTWSQPGKIYGLSTHGEEQAAQAIRLQPDYIGVGPVFATPTKAVPDPTLGLERMGRIVRGTPLTAVAIGGINAQNLRSVLQQGAVNFSCVRPIVKSRQPGQAIRRLMDIWREFGTGSEGTRDI